MFGNVSDVGASGDSSELEFARLGRYRPPGSRRGSDPALNELEVPGTGGTGSDKPETLPGCSHVVGILRDVCCVFFLIRSSSTQKLDLTAAND